MGTSRSGYQRGAKSGDLAMTAAVSIDLADLHQSRDDHRSTFIRSPRQQAYPPRS